MQERQDANHDCMEELVEHRGHEEQADHADGSAERRDLDVEAGRWWQRVENQNGLEQGRGI